MSSGPLVRYTPRYAWLRLGLVAAFVALVAVVARMALAAQLDPKVALSAMRAVMHEWWAVPAFLLTYNLGTALFLPAMLFHLVSGAAWGFPLGVLINVLAVNSSASAQFWLARKLGRSRMAAIIERYRWAAFDASTLKHGFRAMVAIRMLPAPHMAVNVFAGVSSMRWRDFALGSLIGTLPFLVVYTCFAASLVEGVAGARAQAFLRAAVGGLLIIAATFLPKLIARLRRRAGEGE